MLPLLQVARYPAKDGEEKLYHHHREKGREDVGVSVIEGQGLQT